MLRELGVAMGDQVHPLKHEWSPLVYRDGLDVRRSLDNIRRMDDVHRCWGWKSPKDIFSIEAVMHALRGPRVIIVFRNFLDVLESSAEREAIDIEALAIEVGVVHARLGEFIARTPYPVALIAYERLKLEGVRIASTLSQWLGLGASDETIAVAAGFVAARGYRVIGANGALGDLAIDDEELARDRASARASVYGQRIADMMQWLPRLREDCENARAAAAILLHRVASEMRRGASEGGEGIFSGTPRGPDALTPAEPRLLSGLSTEGECADGPTPSPPTIECATLDVTDEQEVYRGLRAETHSVLLERARLQRKLDDLQARLEEVQQLT
jgi:hypothetical protein